MAAARVLGEIPRTTRSEGAHAACVASWAGGYEGIQPNNNPLRCAPYHCCARFRSTWCATTKWNSPSHWDSIHSGGFLYDLECDPDHKVAFCQAERTLTRGGVPVYPPYGVSVNLKRLVRSP